MAAGRRADADIAPDANRYQATRIPTALTTSGSSDGDVWGIKKRRSGPILRRSLTAHNGASRRTGRRVHRRLRGGTICRTASKRRPAYPASGDHLGRLRIATFESCVGSRANRTQWRRIGTTLVGVRES